MCSSDLGKAGREWYGEPGEGRNEKVGGENCVTAVMLGDTFFYSRRDEEIEWGRRQKNNDSVAKMKAVIYIYIYIKRERVRKREAEKKRVCVGKRESNKERERERERREREKERERKREGGRLSK